MSEVLYYLPGFADEAIPFEPTLEGCAYFLLHGLREGDAVDPDDRNPDGAPIAADGDVVKLQRLTLRDHRAQLYPTLNDGRVWIFDPIIPGEATFLAVRYGPGAGWGPEEIFNPQSVTLGEALSEAFPDDDAIENIAIGSFEDLVATFRIQDGRPALVDVRSAPEDEGGDNVG